jgi:polysaccharide export outer membrane protein
MYRLPALLLGVWVILTATSCGNIKNLQYVQGPFDTTRISQLQVQDPIIQKGDLLSILVYSDNSKGTLAATAPIQHETGTESTTPVSNAPIASVGYLVDQQGNIVLYKLGSIMAAGKTKKQLADTIARLYTVGELLTNPYVEVRFLSYKITLIGEVTKPGSYSVPAERINAFEAIGLAGDITPYGRRDNVLVVREVNGKRELGRLDFSKPEVFLSPFYNLQQNDMIIVDVAKNKGVINDQTTVRNITLATSILSTIAIFITIFRR